MGTRETDCENYQEPSSNWELVAEYIGSGLRENDGETEWASEPVSEKLIVCISVKCFAKETLLKAVTQGLGGRSWLKGNAGLGEEDTDWDTMIMCACPRKRLRGYNREPLRVWISGLSEKEKERVIFVCMRSFMRD
jgi:hypothetical protein